MLPERLAGLPCLAQLLSCVLLLLLAACKLSAELKCCSAQLLSYLLAATERCCSQKLTPPIQSTGNCVVLVAELVYTVV